MLWFKPSHGVRRVEITDLIRMCQNKFVINTHCFGLIVTPHNVDLFAVRVAALGLTVSVCHALLAANICCFSVHWLWGLGSGSGKRMAVWC